MAEIGKIFTRHHLIKDHCLKDYHSFILSISRWQANTIVHQWFMTDAYQTEIENSPIFIGRHWELFLEWNLDFVPSHWSRLETVLKKKKTFSVMFPVEKCIFHFDIALCSMFSSLNMIYSKNPPNINVNSFPFKTHLIFDSCFARNVIALNQVPSFICQPIIT